MKGDPVIRLMGPVAIVETNRTVEITSARQRRLLAALAISAPDVVSVDRLVDIVWAGMPPESAPRTLQSYVSRLRSRLASAQSADNDEVLIRAEPGYSLSFSITSDASAFETLAAEAHGAIREGGFSGAVATLERALGLWRGEPIAEFADEVWARPYAQRLAERRVTALEDLAECELRLGDPSGAIARLEQLVGEQPLRERPRALLMRSLFAAGRQPEALRAYREFYVLLTDEVGLVPSPALVELQAQIATGVLALDETPRSTAAGLAERRFPTGTPAPSVFLFVPDRRVLHGRSAELERLVDREGSRVAHTALTGMGGAGKTAIALEYTHLSRHDHAWTGWVPGSSRHSVIDGLARFAPSLGVNAKRQSRQVASDVIRALEAYNGPWLLVVDDAEGPQAVNELLPQTGSGSVVVTTRHRGWATTTFSEIEVGMLNHSAAVELLLHLTDSADEAGAGRLVHRLGAHPLALEQAGAAIAERRWSFERYERLLDERPRELLQLPATSVERTVALVLESAIAQCRRESSVAESVLGVCAYLAPEDIPRSLFEGVQAAGDDLVAGGDVMIAGEAIAALVRFHIVHADDRHLGVHPLVQEIVRETFGAMRGFGDAAVRLVSAAQPQDPFDPSTWDSTRALAGHVDALIRNVRADGQTADLAYWTGSTLLEAGEFDRALGLLRWSHGVALSLWGDRDVRTLDVTNRLAIATAAAGDHDAAVPLMGAVLYGRREMLGPSHPDVLMSITNLGTGLFHLGDLVGAARLYEESLALHVDVMGIHHQDTLFVRHNLAHLHLVTGDVWAARRELDDVVDHARRFLGPKHPDTLNWTNSLSDLMRSQGDFIAARGLLDENVDACCEVLGERHPETLVARQILAQTLLAQGEAGPARDQFRLVLDARRESLGANHPDTIAALDELTRTEEDADA